MSKFIQKHNISNQKFGRLTAVSHVGRGRWMCVCDCGSEYKANPKAHSLINGAVKSCGCLAIERSAQAKERAKADAATQLSMPVLRSKLSYDADTGIFRWLVSPRFSVPAGTVVAGERLARRYLHIGILNKRYPAHRLAWFYFHGEWPKGLIDHINGDPSDNRIANLRDCSASVNSQNQRGPHSRSTTGFLGVTATGSKKRPYRAQINCSGKLHYIGIFETAEKAYAAYVERKRELHEGCTI
jgi:hypothetical protein